MLYPLSYARSDLLLTAFFLGAFGHVFPWIVVWSRRRESNPDKPLTMRLIYYAELLRLFEIDLPAIVHQQVYRQPQGSIPVSVANPNSGHRLKGSGMVHFGAYSILGRLRLTLVVACDPLYADARNHRLKTGLESGPDGRG